MKRFCWWLLNLRVWTFSGEMPSLPRAVMVVAPHTSNWDLPILIVYRYALGIPANYLAKHSLFWWPLGTLLRATGALPVNRSRGGPVIEQIRQQFQTSQQMYLALAPEGTRSFRPYWKSGFYRIARAADVPLVLVSIDYARRRTTLSAPIRLSGDLTRDMDGIRHFYSDATARHPALVGPIRLADEKPTE